MTSYNLVYHSYILYGTINSKQSAIIYVISVKTSGITDFSTGLLKSLSKFF